MIVAFTKHLAERIGFPEFEGYVLVTPDGETFPFRTIAPCAGKFVEVYGRKFGAKDLVTQHDVQMYLKEKL